MWKCVSDGISAWLSFGLNVFMYMCVSVMCIWANDQKFLFQKFSDAL